MKKIIILFFVFLTCLPAFGKKDGGATSGGGDLLGIDATRVAEHVFTYIDIIGPRLYTEDELNVIHTIKKELKIIMVDDELSVQVEDRIQNGSAFSSRDDQSSTIFLLKKDWNTIENLLEREVLIHHEIMILAGLEVTGDYHLSIDFEKLRKNFWQLSKKENVFCTMSVFEKAKYYETTVPGKLIGSSSASINYTGSRGGFGIFAKLENGNALIWRGVISSAGYFRMEIAEAEYNKKGLFEEKKSPTDPLSISLRNLTVKEAEKVYFDPYKIEKPVANPIVFGENYVVVVNCNQY